VLRSDFFLCNVCDEFMEAARLFIFETYCRIHHKIDIAMLAGKMDMGVEAAEKWIVDLIRGSQLDAKIDSRDNHVIMGSSFPRYTHTLLCVCVCLVYAALV
jgi:translation initiation factor 3 subunit E